MKGSSSPRGRSRGALSAVADARRDVDDSPARRAYRRADFDQCRELIDLADVTSPHDAVRHEVLRAYLARETGSPDDFYAAAKRAARDAESGPLHLVASALVAVAARRVGKDREAAKLLDTLESEAQSSRSSAAGEAVVLLAESALAGNEYDRAERLVALNLSANVEEPESLRVRGAIELGRERFARAATAFGAAIDALHASGDQDERLRAALIEHGLSAATETIDLPAAQRFRREYDALVWKAPLAERRFGAVSSLSALALLEGDVESAWALARDAVAYAQTAASKALGETAAARTSTLIGDVNGAVLQLRRAWNVLRAQTWEDGDTAAIVALATFAAEAATRLTTEARKAHSTAQSLGKSIADKPKHLVALEAFAAGRIAEAAGNDERAIGHYERALALYAEIEFRTRAAIVALDLRRLTGDDTYLDQVDEALERAPKAWFRHEAEADDGPVGQLTNAERGVLLELLHGKSTREIAEESDRSEYTISNHTRKIFAAFEVHSRSRLLARCVELGITEETIERGTRPIVPVAQVKRR